MSGVFLLSKCRRVVDKELLQAVRREQCCIDSCNLQAEAAHVKSRGAGGDDTAENVCPLCWLHHGEQHTIGWVRFRIRHPEVRTYAQIIDARRKGER
jgi:hypothetical protein